MKNIRIRILIALISVFCVTTVYAGQKVDQNIDLGGNRSVTWYLPDTTPNSWIYLQHGFQRNKDNIDDLATHLMDNGFMVLTANCSVTKGNPSLARDIANDLMDNPPVPPNGYNLPGKMLVAGHSAGGLFVCYMAGQLVSENYSALRGVLLFDPVDANSGMASTLQLVIDSGTPVLAILANASSCNSSNNALTPLRNLSEPFVGIKLTDNSKHTDAEGASTGGIITWLCGSPQAHNIAYLQDFALHWAVDMVSGSQTAAYYPGGSVLQNLISINDAVLIKELNVQVCGNGIVEDGEECDGGDCCDNSCNFISAGTVCRSAAGECDIAETCTGGDAVCPADVHESDGEVCSAGVCQDGICTEEYNTPPEADFDFSASDLTVSFTDDSYDSDGMIDFYEWDFGDGETSTEQNPMHTYAGDGTYSVTLTVTDNEGATDMITKSVNIGGKTGCGMSQISGTSTASGSNASFLMNALIPLVPAMLLLLIWGFVRRFNLLKYSRNN